MLKLSDDDMPKFMDATDALGAAYCHFLQMDRPETDTKYRGWKDFVNRNQDRVAGK
jgi:crossover junction endodeoxyribonuclease ruvC